MKRHLLVVGTVLALLWVGAPVGAHGDLAETTPARDSTVRKVPRRVSVTFTETPARGGSQVKVRDGCGDQVASAVNLKGRTMEIEVAGARPGKWMVSYRIVSAEDGHPSRGSYGFKVAGAKDCNGDEPDAGPTEGPPEEGVGAAEDPAGSDGGSFPILPVAVGTILIVVVALILRRGSS